MKHNEIRAVCIGETAQALLSDTPQAKIVGVTSRGVFLQLATEWVVFLSEEPLRGPLTINLSPGSSEKIAPPGYTSPRPLLSRVTTQFWQAVIISPGRILFPIPDATIDLQGAATWRPPPRPTVILPPAGRVGYLTQLAHLVLAQRMPEPYGRALQFILTDPKSAKGKSHPDDQVKNVLAQLAGVRQLLRASDRKPNQTSELCEQLAPWLGLGSGLTPSGDDLIIGLLLALSRWGDVLAPGLDLAALQREILPLARRKTTLLSASLIECATQGQGDERLLTALDGIMTGSPDPTTGASHLLQWGNSSGVDALTGMAISIMPYNPRRARQARISAVCSAS